MKFCSKGTHIAEATLTIRKAGDKPLEYLILKMKELIVTSVSTGGSGGEDRFTENVGLNFREYAIKYTPQDEKGSPGTPTEWKWNIATNAEA